MDTDIAPVLEGLEEHYERSRRFIEALQQTLGASSSRMAVLAGDDTSRREPAGDEDARHDDSSTDTLTKLKKSIKYDSAERWMKGSAAPTAERLSRLQRQRRNSITELPEPSRKSLDIKPGVLCFDDFTAPSPAAVACWSGSATAASAPLVPSLPSCSAAASPRGSTHRLLQPPTASRRSISSPIDTAYRTSESRVSHRVSFCTTDAHGRPLVAPTAPMSTALTSNHISSSSGTEDASHCPDASSAPATDTFTGAWTASAPQTSSSAAVAAERALLPSRQSSQQRLISQLKQLRSSGSGEAAGLPPRSAGLLPTTARRASLSSFSPPALQRLPQQQQQQTQDAGAAEEQSAFNHLPRRGSSVASGSSSVRASFEASEAVHRFLHRQPTLTRCPSISASQAHLHVPPDLHHDSVDTASAPSWRVRVRDPAAWCAAVGLAPAAGGPATAAPRPGATSSLVFTRLRSARSFRSGGPASSAAAVVAGEAAGAACHLDEQQASLAAEQHEDPHQPQPGGSAAAAAAARAMLTASGSSRAALAASGHSFCSVGDASCALSGLCATGSIGSAGATSCLYTTAGGAGGASFLSGRSSSCWGDGGGSGSGGSLLPGCQGSVTLPISGPAAARSRLEPTLSQSRRESFSSCEHSPMIGNVYGSGGGSALGSSGGKRFVRNARRSSCDPFLMVRTDAAGAAAACGGGGGGVIGEYVGGRGGVLLTPTAVQRQAMSYGAAEPCNTTGYVPLLTQLAGYVDQQPNQQQQVVVQKPKLGNTGIAAGGGGGVQDADMDMQSPFTAPTWAADERA